MDVRTKFLYESQEKISLQSVLIRTNIPLMSVKNRPIGQKEEKREKKEKEIGGN